MSSVTFLSLTAEQQDLLLGLPFEGRNLITGPPGSGKTLLAVNRATMLDIAGHDVVLLTYSNVLRQYTEALGGHLGFGGRIITCHRWFHDFWRRRYGGAPPTGGDGVGLDWNQVLIRLNSSQTPLDTQIEHLVVDEGQDLPPQFYALCGQLAAHVTVFADDNQRIGDDQSTLTEIHKLLGQGAERHLINGNHRSTRQITRFANHFYCGRGGRPLSLPEREGPMPTIRPYRSRDALADAVAARTAQHPDLEIGVVVQYQQQMVSLLDKLHSRRVTNAQTYASASPHFRSLDFGRPGVRILSPVSAKGQEFDTVFIPNLEQYTGDPSSAALRMKLYVLATRARRELHVSYEAAHEPQLVRDIPDSVLHRVGT